MRVSTSGIVEHISGDCQEVYDSDNSELINFSFTKNIHPEDQQYVLQTLGKILWEQNSYVFTIIIIFYFFLVTFILFLFFSLQKKKKKIPNYLLNLYLYYYHDHQ